MKHSVVHKNTKMKHYNYTMDLDKVSKEIENLKRKKKIKPKRENLYMPPELYEEFTKAIGGEKFFQESIRILMKGFVEFKKRS